MKEKLSDNAKTIYLAGGCFWGVEKYMALISGVIATDVGYANSKIKSPSYRQVCDKYTGAAEAVRVAYNPAKAGLNYLLGLFYDVINPNSLSGQGSDSGSQYRAGIYFIDPQDEKTILNSVNNFGKKSGKPILVEVKKLENYFLAEEYHQKYMDKNPNGYCNISKSKFIKAAESKDAGVDGEKHEKPYEKLSDYELKQMLSPLQYKVTRQNATEAPFMNEFWDEKRQGIYVDITTGEPLFSSTDKFDSGSGWPSFTRPVTDGVVFENGDHSHGMQRIEVRSATGDAHLGHMFKDGPTSDGGLRYCINSASLKFIAKEEMEKEGLGHLFPKIDKINK